MEPLVSGLAIELSKIITGKLLTESQIQSVAKTIVGKYFADWLPTPQTEAEAEERIVVAKQHITEAARIITGLQNDLESQAHRLDVLAKEIEEKKQIAEHYAALAQTNQDTLAAFKAELEETVRKELTAQAEKGKAIRKAAALINWIVTLVVGAALGAWFQFYFEPIFKPDPKVPAATQPSNPQPASK